MLGQCACYNFLSEIREKSIKLCPLGVLVIVKLNFLSWFHSWNEIHRELLLNFFAKTLHLRKERWPIIIRKIQYFVWATESFCENEKRVWKRLNYLESTFPKLSSIFRRAQAIKIA